MKRLLILTLPALLLASMVTEAYGDVDAAKRALGGKSPAPENQNRNAENHPAEPER